jgi:hypothetical protein
MPREREDEDHGERKDLLSDWITVRNDGPLPDSGFHVGRSRTTRVLYAVRAFMEKHAALETPSNRSCFYRHTLCVINI